MMVWVDILKKTRFTKMVRFRGWCLAEQRKRDVNGD